MREKIEIEDDQIRLFRLNSAGVWTVELEVSVQPFMEFLALELPQPARQYPVLPPGCRWYGTRRKAEVLIIEEPPQTRRIRFAPRTKRAGDEAPEQHYELAFPYVIFALFFMANDYEEMKIFYRPAPLSSVEDALYLSNLFNVQISLGHRAHNRACLRPKPDVFGLPLHEKVQRLISHFWDTEFNLDIEDNGFELYAARNPVLASLQQWEKESRDDPLFVLQIPWEPAQVSMMELADSMLTERRVAHGSDSAHNLGDLLYAFVDQKSARPIFDHRLGRWRD